MAKLTDDEQRAIIGERLSNTLSSTHSELSNDREKALDFYYGRPLGNEQEGRAQVVSKDMMDTIEWMMPSFMRIFCTRDAVQFDPVGPEDEDLAKQETAYVSHVLWKKNPGFMVIYSWVKDALMQKVGYVKRGWQDEQKVCFEEYTGLTEDQLALTLDELASQGEVEIVGREEKDGYYNIKVRLKKTYGCEKVECVPPDEIIVDRNCRGAAKTAKFVGHLRKNVSRSELIEEGYDRKLVESLTSYSWTANVGVENARDTVQESMNDNQRTTDTATEEITILECWTYLDVDDDGIAELRHYKLAGNDILDNEEAPEIPIESWTPLPVPHRHVGLGVYDYMEDLQRIKTALQRGLLDNVYFTNAPRAVYDKNTVDLATLQINRPGGHIANDGPPTGAVVPLMYQPIADRLLPVIGYFDEVKETRTGVGRMSVGVDADVLAQSTKGAYMDAKGAANQRIEAIARIFAETGYSDLFGGIHRDLMRHQDWPERFRIRKDWVTANPTEWQERADLTVSVGLGNASKEEIRANLGLMAQAQEKAAMAGIVLPRNVYNLAQRIQTELGFENDAFFTDPDSEEFAQFKASQGQAPDPYLEGEKIKADTKLKEKQIDAAIKGAELAQERDLTITELEVKSGVDLAKAGIGAEVAVARGQNPPGAGGAGAAREQPAQ